MTCFMRKPNGVSDATASRNMAITRLAQKTPLRLKAYYDCNPPGMAHWTYKLFVERKDPDRPLCQRQRHAVLVSVGCLVARAIVAALHET